MSKCLLWRTKRTLLRPNLAPRFSMFNLQQGEKSEKNAGTNQSSTCTGSALEQGHADRKVVADTQPSMPKSSVPEQRYSWVPCAPSNSAKSGTMKAKKDRKLKVQYQAGHS